MRQTAFTKGRLYTVFAVCAALAVFLFARANRLTFPYPWNDEARFYVPAAWWAGHVGTGAFEPLTLNAPYGVFWVPDGFTVLLGLVLKVFGQTIWVARDACEVVVAVAVFLFADVFRRISGSMPASVAATMCLVSPVFIMASNMVRMEAPLILLVAVVLCLHLRGRLHEAAALMALSVLIHPALTIAAVGYLAVIWMAVREGMHARSLWRWALPGLVALCFLLELVRVMGHTELFRLHMEYQLRRKMGHSFQSLWKTGQGALFVACSASIAFVMARRDLWRRWLREGEMALVMLALGMQLYGVLGHEMAYGPYAVVMGPVLVACLVHRGLQGPVRDGCTPSLGGINY